ncbi:hypothetical protein [Actinomadura rugatobispora]|uniref:Uncharacterized protein n=1 Tax=Actinomadura rugatobispora TaxID=1994 RepID=A0ABW1A569_9ACTN|nr:hypothetical protein GCM10010200_026440 [Actinomadura rugatobispora]
MAPTPPTEAEIDTFITTRLRMIGIDLSVLPENDPSAPADRARALAACRSALADVAPVTAYRLDAQRYAPILYPAPHSEWTGFSGE